MPIRPRKEKEGVGSTLFLTLAFFILTLDQLSKFLALKSLALGSSWTIIPRFFDLTLVYNTGTAFGFFRGGTFFLIIITSVSILFLFVLFFLYGRQNRMLALSLGLILGGAFGNWLDRLLRGFVVDFLDFYIGVHHWPAFNVADSAISIGACLLGLVIIKNSSDKNRVLV